MPIDNGQKTGADRAVIADPAGGPVVLSMYADDQTLAAVELTPNECIRLAADLLSAGCRRLS